jgi:hypothetical protein
VSNSGYKSRGRGDHAGKTKYLYEKQYDPGENVNAFINIYFDENIKRIPRLLRM